MTKDRRNTVIRDIIFIALMVVGIGILYFNQDCRDSILSALTLKHSSLPCDKAFIVSYTGDEGRRTYFISARPLTMKGEY